MAYTDLRPHRIARPRRIIAALNGPGRWVDRAPWVVECARRTSTHDVPATFRRCARIEITKAVRAARLRRVMDRCGGIAYAHEIPTHLRRD